MALGYFNFNNFIRMRLRLQFVIHQDFFDLIFKYAPILLDEHALLLLGEDKGLVVTECVLAIDQSLVQHVAGKALVHAYTLPLL